MPKKTKTLLQEMDEALLSHGEAHDVAVKWFRARSRKMRAAKHQRVKGHND